MRVLIVIGNKGKHRIGKRSKHEVLTDNRSGDTWETFIDQRSTRMSLLNYYKFLSSLLY